jgi:RNA polymerase subunit RPABC4/transcription elongation factor Spt4
MTVEPKRCPFCGSSDTVKEADFATSLMVNRRYCRACHSGFEAIKWGDRAEELDLPAFLRTNASHSFKRE